MDALWPQCSYSATNVRFESDYRRTLLNNSREWLGCRADDASLSVRETVTAEPFEYESLLCGSRQPRRMYLECFPSSFPRKAANHTMTLEANKNLLRVSTRFRSRQLRANNAANDILMLAVCEIANDHENFDSNNVAQGPPK